MITEIEKTFFDTFGIEPKRGVELTIDPTTDDNVMNEHMVCYGYPQITDSILLELICILTKFYGELVLEQCLDVKDLKEQVLNIFVRTSYKDNFKHQVRTLFEEG